MALNALTSDYLTKIAASGMRADELVDIASQQLNLPGTTYRGSCLTRPVFVDGADLSRLGEDVGHLHTALTSLPDRLFGGDLTAFARAVGATDAQVRAIARGAGAAPTSLSRADFYQDDSGFRLLEVNMGTTLGGLDNALLNDAFLTHPIVAGFVSSRGLTYLDTLGIVVDTLRAECAIGPGDKPYVVAADWPESYQDLAPLLHYSAGVLGRYGLEMDACSLADLRFHDGRVWLRGRAIDVLYRVFMIEDVLAPEAAELIDPLLGAVERGEVKLFAPMDADVYGSKGALALLSDEANRHVFSTDELASLDRILPWTRVVRHGPVTAPDGERCELADYAIANRAELILKPVMLHGGLGVVPGWTVGPDQWRDQLAAAMAGGYVLQRRVHPVSEPFPDKDGLRPWVLSLSVFHACPGFSGLFVRGTKELDVGVLSLATGILMTCCFHPPLE